MELLILFIFAASVILCVAIDVSILYALVAGYLIFLGYGIYKKVSIKSMLISSLKGISTVKNILITFVLIGMLTALWRAAGTIPAIVCYATKMITPSIFVVMTFLLCCLISFLTGTSFGTAATMGVICMTISNTMGINPTITGGAILSGIFFGDRCSPVSTSALLVSELTKTDIFSNIKAMLSSAAIPFVVTTIIYGVIGVFGTSSNGSIMDMESLFSSEFRIGAIAILPAAIILFLSMFRIKVKMTMAISIAISAVICLVYQGTSFNSLIEIIFMGYHSNNPELASMIDGGGIVSMIKVMAIICISTSYTGLFNETGLLDSLKNYISALHEKTTTFSTIFLTSIMTSIISCNQTLAIILTNQMCSDLEEDNNKFAINLEDTVVVMSPLVPWSIAGAVPIATIGAPVSCLFLAFYLYLLPLWRLTVDLLSKKQQNK